MLLQTPGHPPVRFRQAEAYTRRLPFLTHVVLPRGIVDLGRDIPAQDYHLIAPTATLVAREDLHPALIDLFVQGGDRDPRRRRLVPAAGPVPVAEIHRDPGGARGGEILPRRPAVAAALHALLAGQPVRPAVGGGGGAGRADHPAVRRSCRRCTCGACVRACTAGTASCARWSRRWRARSEDHREVAARNCCAGWTRSRTASTRSRCRWPMPRACTACAAISTSCASGCVACTKSGPRQAGGVMHCQFTIPRNRITLAARVFVRKKS